MRDFTNSTIQKDVTDLSMDNVEWRGLLLGVELSMYQMSPRRRRRRGVFDSISRPSNSISRPSNSISRPSNSISRPSNSISRPSNSISRPSNSISRPSNSISSQYDAVGPKGVVARLVVAGRASSAASIADYLKLGRRVSDYAKAMKASAYVSSSISRNVNMTDSQIAEEVIRIISGEEKSSSAKLLDDNNYTTVTASPPSTGMYASVALAAHRSGRKGVADLLIMLEQSPVDKVKALLAIGSYADAAAVSCRVRDPDLIHTCISTYQQSLPKSDEGKSQYFSGIINKFPLEAVSMFTAYYIRLGGF
jgi:hypothetical protein